ncbi:hypothetical protein ABZP36_034135 [Zizania latifolia]
MERKGRKVQEWMDEGTAPCGRVRRQGEEVVLTNVGRVLEVPRREFLGEAYKDPNSSFSNFHKYETRKWEVQAHGDLPKTSFGLWANSVVQELELQKLWEENQFLKSVYERNTGMG